MIVPPPLRALPSPHRAAIEAAFGPTLPTPGWRPPGVPLVLICFTNRCGSNYLAQVLASTGALNDAGEYFNAPTVLEHTARLGLPTLPAYITVLPGLIPWHGPLAAKAAPDQVALLADAGVLAAWSPPPVFLFLERSDRLGQAISRVIATHTGQFTSAQPAHMAPEDVPYSRAAIDAELKAIDTANALFQHFFRANAITPIHTTYETLLRDPTEVLAVLADKLGCPPLVADPERITLTRQRTEISAEWRRRYQTR